MNLKEARELRGLTQTELSNLTGISQGTISFMEGGLKPTPDQQRKIETALGLSGCIDWSLAGRERLNNKLNAVEQEQYNKLVRWCVSRWGPAKAIDFLNKHKTPDDIRALLALYPGSDLTEHPQTALVGVINYLCDKHGKQGAAKKLKAMSAADVISMARELDLTEYGTPSAPKINWRET